MKKPADDYSEFKEEVPQEEAFARMEKLALEADAKANECADLATALAKAQEELRDIEWRQMPELMDSLGLAEFKHKSGLVVVIKEEIDTSITKVNQSEAHKWLENNGHAGLLKRNVTVAFNKGQEEAAAKLREDLAGKFASVTADMKVHPSTLKAWVKEMLADGKPLPLELFGVYRRRVAKFTTPKK